MLICLALRGGQIIVFFSWQIVRYGNWPEWCRENNGYVLKNKKIPEKMNLEPNRFQKLLIFKTTIDGWDLYILHLIWYNYYIVL